MIRKGLTGISLIALIALGSVVFRTNFAEAASPQSVTDESGIVAHCYANREFIKINGPIKVKNNGLAPLRIRAVAISHGHSISETTRSMHRLNPGDELLIQPTGDDSLYIYSLSGGLIGWIQTFPCKD